MINQLTKGCGKEYCTNDNCASNKYIWKDSKHPSPPEKLTKQEAFKIAVQMAKTISHDCESALCSELKVPKTLQGSDLEDFVSLSEDEKAERFMDVFSSPFSLCFSFL